MTKHLITVLFLLTCGIAKPQLTPVSPTRPTPNAAGIGQYGEMAVSMYTGLPQIDVPIHTIKTDYITLPVSLSYNASGFRPDMHPSWVGLNWNVDAGGAITRTVRHLPDEYQVTGTDPVNITGMGFYYSHNLLAATSWSTPDGNFVSGGLFKDREPDVFSFNFLGKSGKFYLDHTGNWKVQSDEYFKVVFDPADFKTTFVQQSCNCYYGLSRKTFNKFTLIDARGIQYTFGTDNAIEYSVGMTARNGFSTEYDWPSNTMATSWYLVRITDPAGDEITLSYERGPYQSSLSFYQFQNGCTSGDIGGAGFMSRWGLYGGYKSGISGSITSPVYLREINHPKSNTNIYFHTSKSNELKYSWSLYMEILRNANGDLPVSYNGFLGLNMTANIPYFTANPSEAIPTPSEPSTKFIWLKLDSIAVRHVSSFNSRDLPNVRYYNRLKAKFNYTENSLERLRLNSVVLTGDLNSDPQSYQFTYAGDWVAGYAAEITDHWGFANRYFLEKTPLQTYKMYDNLGQIRQPVAGASLAFLLKEIRYPTGGRSVFTFENHDYRAYAWYEPGSTDVMLTQQTGIAGGARLKKIENFDNFGNRSWRDYLYVTDYNPATGTGSGSSGILVGKARYNWTFNQGGFYAMVSSSSSIVPTSSTSSGRHIGYTYVTERFQDGSYKNYTFSNEDLGYKDIAPVYQWNYDRMPQVPFNSTEFERGKLLEERTYSAANKLLTKTQTTYNRIGFTTDNFVRAVMLDYSINCVGSDVETFPAMTSYYHYTHFFKPVNIKQYTYDEFNRELLVEKTNEYDTYGNITRQIDRKSDGSLLETRYTYPYNYPSDPLLTEMKNRNRISDPITVDKYKGTTFLEGNKFNYAYFNSNSLIALSSVQRRTGNGNYFLKYAINKYDNNGNLLEIEKPGGQKESFIYAYFGRFPVASIQGKDHATAAALLNTDILNWPDGNSLLEQELDKLRTQLPGALVQTTTFNFYGDVDSQKDHAGKKNSYEYDDRGRLTLIRDQDNNILKRFQYKYLENLNYPFVNTEQSRRVYAPGPCQTGYQSNGVNYIVPAGKHGSFLSVADANLKANQEIDAEGPAYAAIYAPCVPYWLFTPCCTWSSVYSDFSYDQGTVNFRLTLMKSPNTMVYGQIGQLDGILFIPASAKYLNLTATNSNWSGTLVFYPDGKVNIMGQDFTDYITIIGSYTLE